MHAVVDADAVVDAVADTIVDDDIVGLLQEKLCVQCSVWKLSCRAMCRCALLAAPKIDTCQFVHVEFIWDKNKKQKLEDERGHLTKLLPILDIFTVAAPICIILGVALQPSAI